MWRCLDWSVDVSHQGWIRADVNDAAENTQIGLAFIIDCADQACRFEARQAVDKIRSVKPFPRLDCC
jgi:hypothetical protein